MPRDGAQTYSVPGGTDGVPDTPVLSTPYNGFLRDLEHDLNTPRPIPHGGTGATNERDAMIALKGELATQGPITNYASFPFLPGSFYSDIGAADAPPSGGNATDYFLGICYGVPGSSQQLEVRAYSTHAKYFRSQVAGVWQPWTAQVGPVTDMDAALALKVAKAGDTMTGDLTITRSFAPTTGYLFYGNTASRYLGYDGAKFVANTDMTVSGALTTGSHVIAAQSTIANQAVYSGYNTANSGTYYFGSNNTKYLTFDTVNYSFIGGGLYAPNITSYGALSAGTTLSAAGRISGYDMTLAANAYVWGAIYTGYAAGVGGAIYFGSSAAASLWHDGSNRFTLANGQLRVGGNAIIGAEIISTNGIVRFSEEGAGGASSGKYLNFNGTNYVLTPGQLIVNGLGIPAGNIDIAQGPGSIYQGGRGSIMITANGDYGYDAFITYHRPGAYAVNMGLMANNRFGYGGWSAGAIQYKFWSEQDFTSLPTVGIRLIYVGDYGHVVNSAMIEPYGATAVVTGSAGFENSVGFTVTMRYRAMQVYNGSDWVAVGSG